MSQLHDRSKSRLIRVSVPALLLIALSLGLTAVAVHWESRHDDTLTVFLLSSMAAVSLLAVLSGRAPLSRYGCVKVKQGRRDDGQDPCH